MTTNPTEKAKGQDVGVAIERAKFSLEARERTNICNMAFIEPEHLTTLLASHTALEEEAARLKGWIEAKHVAWDLEYSQGAHFAWVVWALKPGVAHLAAICTTEKKANRYMEQLPEHGGLSYRGSKMWKERVPLNHAFGWKDSVAALLSGKATSC
jgi:hypothetical protein